MCKQYIITVNDTSREGKRSACSKARVRTTAGTDLKARAKIRAPQPLLTQADPTMIVTDWLSREILFGLEKTGSPASLSVLLWLSIYQLRNIRR